MGNNGHLNERQRLFSEKIVVNPNATQAAINAGYSTRSASSIGYENLQKPKIRRYISHLRQERNLRTQVTADRVLAELAKITFAEKGVKTGYKLKALDMLAKHVGLYDKQSGENPEILKETELPQTRKEALSDREETAMAIFRLLDPRDRESIRKALDRKKAQMEKDEDIDFDYLDFMTELWTKENLKNALGRTIDRIYDRWQ